MKSKVLLLSLLFSFMIPLGVFAQIVSTPLPHDYKTGLLDDNNILKSITSSTGGIDRLYDNDLSTRLSFSPLTVINIEFNELVNIDSMYINSHRTGHLINVKIDFINEFNEIETKVVENYVDHVGYYDVNVENVLKIDISRDGPSLNYDFYELDFFGTYGTDLEPEEPEEPIDEEPPFNISNLDYTVTEKSITFNYDLPEDEDFSHIKITRDGQTIADNHILNSFTDNGLASDTHYVYVFTSVDTNGNESESKVVGARTNILNDEIPPEVPTGLKVEPFHSALSISWNQNNESDLAGYFIYLNGEKYNTSPIVNNQYSISNLVNGMNYEIQISSIDTSGNESDLSSIVSMTPSENELPIFSLTHDLSDVAKSTENWFSELWLVLAFSVAIPLSFMIAQRVKSLFLA